MSLPDLYEGLAVICRKAFSIIMPGSAWREKEEAFGRS